MNKLKCKECNGKFTVKETDRIYGKFFSGRGKFCSAVCWTKNITKKSMSKYQSNQCPECGCSTLNRIKERKESQIIEFISEISAFNNLSINQISYKKLYIKCNNCNRKLNTSESIKQGKIILVAGTK